MAAMGQVYPTDQLALMGQPYWRPATAFPELLPPARQSIPNPDMAAQTNSFANPETDAEFEARMPKQAKAAAGDVSSIDASPARDVVKDVRTILDTLADWFSSDTSDNTSGNILEDWFSDE
jgi:hypothetical protein